jgi:hypothetical protein
MDSTSLLAIPAPAVKACQWGAHPAIRALASAASPTWDSTLLQARALSALPSPTASSARIALTAPLAPTAITPPQDRVWPARISRATANHATQQHVSTASTPISSQEQPASCAPRGVPLAQTQHRARPVSLGTCFKVQLAPFAIP